MTLTFSAIVMNLYLYSCVCFAYFLKDIYFKENLSVVAFKYGL